MRSILPLLSLFLISSLAQSQIPFDISHKRDLGKWELLKERPSDSILIQMGHRIDAIRVRVEEGDYTYASMIDMMHVLDFNCDGIQDVILSGSLGGESTFLEFFVGQSDSSFRSILSLFGDFIDYSDPDGFTPLTFTIEQYSCCMGTIDHFETYSPVWKGDEFHFEMTSKYSMHNTLEIPEKRFTAPIAFRTVNDAYTLRTQPVIDDTSNILVDDDVKGNTFASYPKGSEGYAIAERTDATGRVWWFVIMKNNLPPLSTLYYHGENNKETGFTLGWMSSTYLKKI